MKISSTLPLLSNGRKKKQMILQSLNKTINNVNSQLGSVHSLLNSK